MTHHVHTAARTRRIVLATAVTAALTAASACGVPSSGDFEAFADENQLGFGATSTTSTTVVTTGAPQTTEAAPTTTIETEPVTLYFLAGQHASSVSIVLARPAAPLQVLTALADGPPDGQVGTGLRSALPSGTDLGVENARGGVVVTVPEGFFSRIPPSDQRLAVAQIVLTLTERGGVGTVQFQQGSTPIAVPKGSGVSTAPGEPVYRDDYLNLLTQVPAPPPAATSTAATTTATTTAGAGARG